MQTRVLGIKSACPSLYQKKECLSQKFVSVTGLTCVQDRLASMGKEGLFFRMIELVQYEGSTPGGFSPERQQSTLEKVEKLFADNGVDFRGLLNEMGVELPGVSTS